MSPMGEGLNSREMDCTPIFEAVLNAGRRLNLLDERKINQVLIAVADAALARTGEILAGNEKDLARMDPADPKYDRLLLSESRIAAIATDIKNVAALPSPVGKVLSAHTRPNGLIIKKVSVPFGVIGIIYEARPNVTFDVFSLCLKSGNACILKGGSDAIDSNSIIVDIIHDVLKQQGIDKSVLALLPAGRDETQQLLNARGYVDLIIPRGSQQLINFVRENATIPVIETGAGICHTYFDETGDKEKGRLIIHNAKTRRPGVCNALDCLIVDQKRLNDLPYLVEPLAEAGVLLYADEKAFPVLSGKYPANLLQVATEESFGTEFLSLKASVKTVTGFDEAMDQINRYSSKHSEAIISENRENIDRFQKMVDASSVYSNASTAYTDGAQFGLGAEIGISTQKLHARGPMALEELTSYKYIIEGNGQIRP